MMKPNLLLALVLAASHASAAPKFASHCKGGETTYFNCAVKDGSKVVSLCGKDEDGARSYLQYRYGTPRQPLELVYPPAIRDAAMGETFFFDSYVEKDGSQTETGVWFEHDNTYYKLRFGVNHGLDGQLTTSESAILMWAGVPSGAPRSLLCKQTHGGDKLSKASGLIRDMSPKGRVWKMSPLDVHYQPKSQPTSD